MAGVNVVLQFIYFCTCLFCIKCVPISPAIYSLAVIQRNTINESVIHVQGSHLTPQMQIHFTPTPAKHGTLCGKPSDHDTLFNLNVFNSTDGFVNVKWSPKVRKKFYFCVSVKESGVHVGEVIKWVHQGRLIYLDLGAESRSNHIEKKNSSEHGLNDDDNEHRKRRDTNITGTVLERKIIIHGFRIERSDHSPLYGDDGVVELLTHTSAVLRLFGEGISPDILIGFTTKNDVAGHTCEFPNTDTFEVKEASVTDHSAIVEIVVPSKHPHELPFYFCIKDKADKNSTTVITKRLWIHQGSEHWMQFRVYEKVLPNWATAIIIVILLIFSALFSGLTLGLMSMDKTDLKILCATGTDVERKYASAIMPVRSHGSMLLCSLLLGNVLVNSVLTILMDDLTSGLIAVIFSTLAIVIFGEIMPQAICSRHGLAVGAKTIYITKFVILLTFLVAYPISKILDYMLGEEIGNVYNRERLKELVKTGTDIEKDEVNIISGALELRKKIVADVMTKIEDVYMLDYNAVLDFETVSDIMKSGFSRIPIYEGRRSNIISMLYIKDLAFVDPDDNTPLKTLCEFYQNPCYFIFEDMTLDVLFREFKEGNKGHMAFVHRVNSEGEGDPFYEVIGLITLEDVIEELIQAEIVDETDVWTDNRSKRKRERGHALKTDFTQFAERREHHRIPISPQLILATFQYLSSTVDCFKPPIISETILRRLLRQDVIFHIKVKNKDKHRSDQASTIIFQQGKPADYFVIILEGRVEVIVGKEEMRFESGPFTYFGSQALVQNMAVGDSPISAVPSSNMGSIQSVNTDTKFTFVPDYTVRAITEVFYAKIKQSLYIAAKKATLMENKQKVDDHNFDDEVEKLLHSLDEDDRSQGQGSQDSPVLTRDSFQRSLTIGERGPASIPSGSPPSAILNSPNSSPLELNGSVKTPLSPSKPPRMTECNKISSGDSNSEHQDEERTNLLSINEQVS